MLIGYAKVFSREAAARPGAATSADPWPLKNRRRAQPQETPFGLGRKITLGRRGGDGELIGYNERGVVKIWKIMKSYEERRDWMRWSIG
jgi:hypothetical protein